jgi:tetratricopeptide (TPR) repeat protein
MDKSYAQQSQEFWHCPPQGQGLKATSQGFMRLVSICSLQQSDRELRALVSYKAQNGDYTSAISLLNQLLSYHPDSAIDYNNRGLMYFYQGKFDQALTDYNRAIALNSRLDSAYNNRANCYVAQGDFVEALQDYEVALDLNPRNLQARINQGITFRELGLYDLAIESFDLCSLLAKRLKDRIYGERGYTYYLRGDWNCAIADYYRSLQQPAKTPSQQQYRHKILSWLSQLESPLDLAG